MVKNLPSNTEDVGLILGQGTKIPHTVEQLSPHDATTDLCFTRVCAPQQKILHDAMKTARAATKTQGILTNKKTINVF